MSQQVKRQFESFPTNYYTEDFSRRQPGQIAHGNMMDPRRFYSTQGSSVPQKRGPGTEMDQFDEGSEGYYEDPDAEAQYLYPQAQPEIHYTGPSQTQPRNYYSVSPEGGFKSHSPYPAGYQGDFGAEGKGRKNYR